MAFNTSISGLQAAQQDMGVISNNIANVGTTGFKRSDSLFAELYTASLGGAGPQPGSGVTLERIRSDFGQGSFEFTSSQLDLAIDGNGLFVLQNGAETLYTRAGAFRLDNDGFVVTEGGANLQGYGADGNGQINTALGNLQITNALLAQKPTEEITFNGNLDSRAAAPTTAPFDATNPETFNFTSTTTVYDSAGAAHQVTLYFVRDEVIANQYGVTVSIDDVVQPETASLLFDNAGVLDATSATALNLASYTPANANAQAININFTSTTTVYDSAGAAHQVTLYFAKDATVANQYNVTVSIDDVVQPETASLLFDNTGVLDANSVTALNLASYTPANANAQAININFANITGYGANSATSGVTQDGYAAGQLAGFEFDRTGIAYATYTNGETRAVGQVALATFTNPGGLESAGKTNFAETSASGIASIGTPDSGARGIIRPSALESANVDLTVELLALIEAQRNFQSNAQAIQNANDASQAILQLR